MSCQMDPNTATPENPSAAALEAFSLFTPPSANIGMEQFNKAATNASCSKLTAL